jgi:predicted phage terminase large subunit-like protein
LLAGFRVVSGPETGSKAFRAGAIAAQVGAGNVSLRRAHWNDVFLDELTMFPHGSKDDQVDALSRAFNLLATPDKSARFTSLPFLGR